VADSPVVAIRGGGDLGTGVALRLQRAGCRVAILEIQQPTVIRRTVAFASAVFDGAIEVEGTVGRLGQPGGVESIWGRGEIPVLIDPQKSSLRSLRPDALVDAILAKRNLGTHIDDAPVVVGLGPGFTAGVDCHAVVETNRGHNLGRVYYSGSAQPNTGVPGTIGGQDAKRALRAPIAGEFIGLKRIGDRVQRGDAIGRVGEASIVTEIDGVLRGVLHDGLTVPAGLKVADVDPRGVVEH
jgi:xanthine dehydrogenase accessory factor